MNRRHFLASSALAAASISTLAVNRPRRLLLRSAWPTVNIGDLGHTSGMLALIAQHLPDVEVRLWPGKMDNGADQMLRRRFPKVAIVEGDEAVKTAFTECDFLLHGSGPSLVAESDLARWYKETGKPFGIGGITFSTADSAALSTLNQSRFAFFRDSISLRIAKERGCIAPVIAFGPDGAFAVDLKNDEAADAFLKANKLEDGKFLCAIPRLRNPPSWKLKPGEAFDEKKHARNEAMKEHDHAPLRNAIIEIARQTNLKILVCPEDASQMEVGKELLVDTLPADVRSQVVWREKYWLTDEAVSTYRRSAGLFGNEMHSPIMCVGNGIPAIVCRWTEQTSKGFMWRDIGLGDWLFDLDREPEAQKVAPAILALAKDPVAAKARALKARDFVRQRQGAMMAALRRTLEEG